MLPQPSNCRESQRHIYKSIHSHHQKYTHFIYHDGQITSGEQGIKFKCTYPRALRIGKGIRLESLKQKIHEKIRVNNKSVAKIYYRCPMNTPDSGVRFGTMTLTSDNDIRQMFAVFNQHPTASPIELYVVLARSDDNIMELMRESRSVNEIMALLRCRWDNGFVEGTIRIWWSGLSELSS